MYVKGFVTFNLYNVAVVLKDTIAFLLSIYPYIYNRPIISIAVASVLNEAQPQLYAKHPDTFLM